eukprot:TRINITY_DN6861_c0_g1_i1.p8 TRINITY_DN6861_c0_g1~~TRINITY_DN6861_c0_g1_i1.p8  ORF type:complete len:117 (-),score=4.24 TRINITY_DN6861_c0_g1_i1:488-838(-)
MEKASNALRVDPRRQGSDAAYIRRNGSELLPVSGRNENSGVRRLSVPRQTQRMGLRAELPGRVSGAVEAGTELQRSDRVRAVGAVGEDGFEPVGALVLEWAVSAVPLGAQLLAAGG